MLSILAQKASYVQQLAETAFFEDLLHREMYVYLGKEKNRKNTAFFLRSHLVDWILNWYS